MWSCNTMCAQFWSLGEKKPCGSAYQHTFECFRRSNHVTRICWRCWERKFGGVAIWTITMMVCATLWMTPTHQCSGNVSFRRKLGARRLLKLLFYVNMNLWCPSDRRVASSMIVTFYLIYSLHFVMYIHGLGFIRFTMLVFMISIFSFNREYKILNAKWERERPI